MCSKPIVLPRMMVLHTPFVIPTQLDFVAMLLMIGLFGFCAQVDIDLFLFMYRMLISV